jgi:outer membrane receptor for monomeric catechols
LVSSNSSYRKKVNEKVRGWEFGCEGGKNNTMAKRYQREVIRICKSKKNRQHNGQKIPKGGNQNL